MANPADALDQLWARGQGPELAAFLASVGDLPPAQLAELIRVDQRQRWQAGQPVHAEDYLKQFPTIEANVELAIDLIFNEFLVRDDLDERPDPEEYLRRFPAYASVLKDQFELHRALATANMSPSATAPGREPVTSALADLPEKFGRYLIIKRLGQGGMGTVYLAEDTRLQRQVALKVPRLIGDDRPRVVERFYREARIAGTLRHANLCPVYDVGEIEGIHFLTMPLLVGEPLSALLKRDGPLPQSAACQLATQVARAVHVAHQAGVVHRDLKPSNIMIADDGTPVVMDFGLARSSDSSNARLTSTGQIVGTGAYAAPEQLGADASEIGPASDIYSLGVVLYEMLTGRVPFEGRMREVLRAVLTEPPPPPRQFRTDIDRRLEAICLKTLAKDPAERFASMAELAEALDRFSLQQLDMDGETGSFRARAIADPRGRKKRFALWAALGAIVLGVVLWLAFREKATTPHDGPAADLLPQGSVWKGEFNFPDLKYTGDVAVSITERDGTKLRGIYQTERGDYQWRIEGTLDGNAVQWGFTEIVHEREARQVVGNAHVEGTLTRDEMSVTFHHPVYRSTAYMKLRREK